ncbi:DNA repair-scaffolding protein isoform X2 [Stigmatopora argus]
MSSRKRKKWTKDLKYVYFPDDIECGVREVRKPSTVSSASLSRSWEKCGKSFSDSTFIKDVNTSGRKLHFERNLAHSSVSDHRNEDPVDIAWSSSSDSEQSDKDDAQQQRHHRSRVARRSPVPTRTHPKALHTLTNDEADMTVIETDGSEQDVEKDSDQEISDCESPSCDDESKEVPAKPIDVGISGFASDGETGDILSTGRLNSESVQGKSSEGIKRSVSEWVRCVHAMSRTPKKAFDQQSKTPEDSAKKKRRLQPGGLAERLNRLNCRQRSAVSLWMHHSTSDNWTDTEADRPGVLVLEVLEVQEECGAQLVHCQHRLPPGHTNPLLNESLHVLVMLCRETAAQLSPVPADIIHIYPPWLCLLVQDSFGMFSVVQLHLLTCWDDLVKYSRAWCGRICMLRSVKVVQRITRERRSSLFSLMDSLWPPLKLSLEGHGNTPSMASSRPPSFCYVLSGQENSIEPVEEGPSESLVHLPPKRQMLQDILQSDHKTRCCSFFATVIYKKIQSGDIGQREVWLVLTDQSLQEALPSKTCRRTVSLHVNTSCGLNSHVRQALNDPAACCLSFTDVVKEQGVLLCVEHSIIDVKDSAVSHLMQEPPAQPAKLDLLDVEITPNSLCSFTGVIIGVDETASYSWPVCNHCESDKLETIPLLGFHCGSCKSPVDKPIIQVQMEVFLGSPSLPNCTIKVKLQQNTIKSLLDTAVVENKTLHPEYEVSSVLGKEVGPLTLYVRVVTRRPSLWISLEEICL